MAKREVKRSFTLEEQRQEINLIGGDAGDKDQLNTLTTGGQDNLVEAVNEVIETPKDEIFIDEIGVTTEEQKLLFANESSFIDSASYDKDAATNPSGYDYSRIAYDAGQGTEADRLSYNSSTHILRSNNVKADIRNRNQDAVLNSPGQEVFAVNTDIDGHSPSETARVTGRLRTKGTNSPIEIQRNLIKLEESARMSLANSSAIDLATGVDIGASINVTNNKKILYVSANDENASDLPSNDGSNINKPFRSIERALIEASKRSYVAPGQGTELGETGADLFENFTILLFPGEYIIDNRPGVKRVVDGYTNAEEGQPFTRADIAEEIKYWNSGEEYATSDAVAAQLYKFNPPEGGLIVPRGTSIVGLDLRKTLIRPKYVPDPADDSVKRSAIFRLTGACYIWQFTVKDTPNAFGSHHKLTVFEYANYVQLEDYYKKIDKYSRKDESTSPRGGTYNDAENQLLKNRRFIAELSVAYVDRLGALAGVPGDDTLDEYINDVPPGSPGETYGAACVDDVANILVEIGYHLSYDGNSRVAAAAQIYVDNPGLLLTGERDETVKVFKVADILSRYIINNYDVVVDKDGVVAADLLAAGLNISETFTEVIANTQLTITQSQSFDFNILPDTTQQSTGYEIDDNTDPGNCANVQSTIGVLWGIMYDTIQALIDATALPPELASPTEPTGEEDYNQRIEENRIVGFVQNKYLSDTVASASPYVFNISLRSVWGLCGLLSDGAQSTGLRSMVLAQYTAISLQRDDRAFILNGTTTDQIENPDERHSNSIAEYRPEWRHFHIKSRNNSFLQVVSVFAVGQADHFTVETGGDHSITNSNSNFGNQSLIAVNHRTEIFNQDNGGFIVGIVPPRGLDPDAETSVPVYNIDYGTTLSRYDAAEVSASEPGGFKKIYVKVNGESLIKEGEIPEYYSIDPTTGREQAELILDDVNYLLGKRTYSDGDPEAIYANLPKNFDDSELNTFAARLRNNKIYSANFEDYQYDPIPSYSEGKITGENATIIGSVPSPSEVNNGIKSFYVLPSGNTDTTATAGFGNTNLLENNGGFSVLPNSAKYFGSPTSGNPTVRGSVRLKLLLGSADTNFRVLVAEGPIRSVGGVGDSVPATLPTEVVEYIAIDGVPSELNQVQYTYTGATHGGLESLDSSYDNGQGAQFKISVVASTNDYIIEIINPGINYNVGDQFTILGSDLGGSDGAPGVGNDLTFYVLETSFSGEGVQRNNADFECNFSDGTNSESARIYTTEATLPSNVIVETNELYTFNSLQDVDYTIASGGFDAKYAFTLRETGGPAPWENFGDVDGSVVSQITATTLAKSRMLGGSGFSASAGFDRIKFPGSKLKGVDSNNDFTVTVTTIGGATIDTLNFNDDTAGFAGNPSNKRKYYGWEFARTIDGEFFGRLVILVDDERKNGTQIIVGIPTSFKYTNAGTVFNGYQSETTLTATAKSTAGLIFSRDIVAVTNNLDNTFDIEVTNPADKPEHPFFNGDIITIAGVSNLSGDTLNGSFRVTDRLQADGANPTVRISVSNGISLPTTNWQVGAGSVIQKTSKETEIPVQVEIGNIVGNTGQVVNIYPFNYDIGAGTQTIDLTWVSSGSNIAFDDVFILNTGAGTAFLPLSNDIQFQVDDTDVLATGTVGPISYGASSIKEEGYLTGSALGIDYTPFDDTQSLENQTNVYDGESIENPSLSLFRRITQRVDTDGSNTLEGTRDSFEFNDNIISNLYIKRIQDSRAANGNSELLWRFICKLPKDGYNNIKLRAPEVKFILHLKDPSLTYDDDTLDFPFVYDTAQIGTIREVDVDTSDGAPAVVDGTNLTVTTVEYKKSIRRGGTGDYVNYDTTDTTNTIGAENLNPTGATFDIVSGVPSVAAAGNGGTNYSDGDRLTLSNGTRLIVRVAVTTYPKAFYVQKVEPIVEYDYNQRDGYYLLTLLDANIYEKVDSAGNVSEEDKRITYGKQRLIGLEELDGDGIPDEINHKKQDGSDLIEKNRLFIQEESAGFLIEQVRLGAYPGYTNPDPERCTRDVGYILNALIKDLRLGGNNNSINTAQYYFSAGTQQFIEGTDLQPTIDTFEYTKNLAIAAMRNWEFFAEASASPSSNTYTFAPEDMEGIVVGMELYEVTGITTLPTNETEYNTAFAARGDGADPTPNLGVPLGFVETVDYTTSTITVSNQQDRSGATSVTAASNTELILYFKLATGMGGNWFDGADAYVTRPVSDTSVIEDYDYSNGGNKCNSVRSAISVLWDIISDVLNAQSADVTSGASTATFEVPTGTIVDGDILRIFGAQNAAFNQEEVLIEAADISGGSPNDTITYDLDVTFPSVVTDKILYYKSDVVFTEPTKTSYNTEEVVLEGLGYNQNINYLYPETDLDNPKWNPLPSVTRYRKDVGNTIIDKDQTDLSTDGYERISQYSITAESTKTILNNVLNANGLSDRSFSELDLTSTPFGAAVITDTEMQAPYGSGDSKNLYGVAKSPVLEFTAANVPIFTDRCILFNKAIPVSFYRPSIIRASSHTWEYEGFGPGNYSTALPQFQDITLTIQETVNSQTSERGGGFVASSGTNSVGDFYIGNQIIDAKGNQSNTLNFPRVKTSAENRLIDYTNLDSLAANSSTASFNPSSFSAVLTNDLQAIQEAQRNSFKASNIESSILTSGTLKVNNKISIANAVFENENNFPVARQDKYGFTKRSPINWFNTDPASDEYQALADSFISPTDLTDWANVNSLIPSTPVVWTTNYKPEGVYNNFTNTGEVDINETLTKSVNFIVEGIDPIDERWYDVTNDTLGIPLGTPTDDVNNTNLATYDGRAGQIFVTFPTAVNAAFIAPTNIWKPVDNTWTSIDAEFGNPVNYIRGTKFIVSYYITNGEIIYAVSTLDTE